MKSNVLYEGDNLEIMRSFESNSIDLIYIDPPFFTQTIRKQGDIQFSDRWKAGIHSYIEWMRERIIEIHKVLKETGSIFFHCDYRAVHRLKIIIDEVFNQNNFMNQITLKRHGRKGLRFKFFDNISDNILIYCKDKSQCCFNPIYIKEHSSLDLKKKFKNIEEGTGKRFEHFPLEVSFDSSKKDKTRFINGKEITTKFRWIWNQKTFDKRLKQNPNIIYWTKNNRPRVKKYLNDYKGIKLGDMWTDISYLYSNDKERIGYPTQKPIALLNRIIECSTNKGDLVLDCFAGSGTTLSSAQGLQRRWIGIDSSKDAIDITKKRMKRDHNLEIEVLQIPYEF